MTIQSLLAPKSVAVVGVSTNPKKLGSLILKNCQKSGFTDELIAINPKQGGKELQGVNCFASVKDVPFAIDLVIIVVPAPYVLSVIADCILNKTKSIIVISAGFGEIGNTSDEATLRKECAENNIALLGPNCLGAILPSIHLNASFSASFPQKGPIAFVSQSGAFCTAALDWADQKNVGFSHFISLGNKAGLHEADFLQAFMKDPTAKILAFYLESITDGKAWLKALETCTKPVIVLEPGESIAAQTASASHTGALAPNTKIMQAAYKKHGVIQVKNMRDMFGVLELLTKSEGRQLGKNIALVTNAGGVGVMASDLTENEGLQLATLSDETTIQLQKGLPAEAGLNNPIDVIGDAPAARYQHALEVLIRTSNIDQILVLLTPQATTEVAKTAEIIADLRTKTQKNIVASFIGGTDVARGNTVLQAKNVPFYTYPADALRAMGLVASAYKEEAGTVQTGTKNAEIVSIIEKAKQEKLTSLSGNEVKRICEILALPHPLGASFAEKEELAALNLFQKITQKGTPCVLKIAAPDALHKTELKGVRLNITTVTQFKEAWEQLWRSIRTAKLTNAKVQVQQQIPNGHELIIGLKRDETFGPVMVFGTGGIYSEVWNDTSITLLPATDWEHTIRSTKMSNIIAGARGQKADDIASLIDILTKLQHLFLAHEDIAEMDLNPVILRPEGAWCVDVKIIL